MHVLLPTGVQAVVAEDAPASPASPGMIRTAIRTWVAAAAASAVYLVLRATVFAAPSGCPDTVWESTDDPRCDWTWADTAWAFSIPVLALSGGLLLVTAAMLRVRRRKP